MASLKNTKLSLDSCSFKKIDAGESMPRSFKLGGQLWTRGFVREISHSLGAGVTPSSSESDSKSVLNDSNSVVGTLCSRTSRAKSAFT